MSRRITCLVSLLLLGACASTSGAPLAETSARLSMHDFMKKVIDPAANIVFAAGNEEEGPKDPAKEAAKWKAALEAAGTLQESGRLLLVAPRARAEKEWTGAGQLMIDAAAAASAAAADRNLEAAFEAGGKLYDSCNGCHSKYIHGKT